MERARELRKNAAHCLRLSKSINSPDDIALLETLAAQATEEAEQMEALEAVHSDERHSGGRMAETLADRDAELRPATVPDRRRSGRRDDLSAMLIPLLRENSLKKSFIELIDDEPDQLRAFGGIFIWALVTAAVWATILWWAL
jgi:GAF domain-containing protein